MQRLGLLLTVLFQRAVELPALSLAPGFQLYNHQELQIPLSCFMTIIVSLSISYTLEQSLSSCIRSRPFLADSGVLR